MPILPEPVHTVQESRGGNGCGTTITPGDPQNINPCPRDPVLRWPMRVNSRDRKAPTQRHGSDSTQLEADVATRALWASCLGITRKEGGCRAGWEAASAQGESELDSTFLEQRKEAHLRTSLRTGLTDQPTCPDGPGGSWSTTGASHRRYMVRAAGAPGRVQTLAAVTLRDGPLRGEGEWVRLGWAGLHGLHAATVSDATARTAPHL